MMNTGIYVIEHLASGKKYVGSAVNIEKRWGDHRRDLGRRTHHASRLQNSWNKYGEEAFEFRKLLICSKENLLMYEQICMDHYQVCDRERGYNTVPTAGSQLGYRHSDASRAKNRAAKLGHKRSAESVAKQVATMTGVSRAPFTAAHRANIAAARARQVISAESNAKGAATRRGQKRTPEQRANMSAAQKLRFARERAANSKEVC